MPPTQPSPPPAGVSMRELPVPADLDAPDAWLLRGQIDAANEVAHHVWGTRDHWRTPHEALRSLHMQEYTTKLRLVALDESSTAQEPARVLGYAALDLPRQDNTHTGYLGVAVRPAARGRGIGSALHDAALEIARTHGRTMLTAETDQTSEPADDEHALAPTSGTGRVRRDDPDVRFAMARGWTLEQVERYSVLDVPVPPAVLARQRADAQAAAGPDYRVVLWSDTCPQAWVDQYAVLLTRMSTDVPLGGIDWHEDVWDAARVRSVEQLLRERGMDHLVAAVEHTPTGTLAAFTSLETTPVTEEFVYQDDTLVLREHRGRRLGMLAKTANLQRLAAERPAVRRIGTWNAEENAHMLAINVALGFRPAGGTGEWQRSL
ncbi:GNAT family N-acetyltransferase [Cellulomonas soli]|uniref:GNAT family N-acetyltransferase n=1 Tax=Cellulomonas soli TaxID=931535 RepID=UPI003F86EADA